MNECDSFNIIRSIHVMWTLASILPARARFEESVLEG